MKHIRLLLIEDNRLLRDGITAMLKGQRDIRVIATSRSGRDALRTLRLLKPNVILLDLGLRSQNSLRVMKAVKKELPKARVILMDFVPVKADITQFVKAGASGFILKDATGDDFLATIRAVADGEKVLSPNLTESFFTKSVEGAIMGGTLESNKTVRMTPRERTVIRYLSNGSSHAEIAKRLRVTAHTVNSHVDNIMEKLALHALFEIGNGASGDGTPRKHTRSSATTNHKKDMP